MSRRNPLRPKKQGQQSDWTIYNDLVKKIIPCIILNKIYYICIANYEAYKL